MKILSRRNVMYAALISAAMSSAIATAAAISTVAMGATISLPAAATCSVSPRMSALVEMHKAVSANIDMLDPHTNEAAWTAAEQAWTRAEADLINERPQTVCDLAVKLDALLDIDASEGEYPTLKRLSEDAHALAGVK